MGLLDGLCLKVFQTVGLDHPVLLLEGFFDSSELEIIARRAFGLLFIDKSNLTNWHRAGSTDLCVVVVENRYRNTSARIQCRACVNGH